jgi:hypothetical protein
MRYRHVKINPWVGGQYGSSELFNGPLLVVGESEYQAIDGQPPSRHDTQWCVRHVIKDDIHLLLGQKKRGAFWTKTASLLLGHKPLDAKERARFWHSVAYYNFIQTQAGSGSRVRKKREVWLGAQEAFREVLRKLNPEYVVVLGFENWYHRGQHDSRGLYVKSQPPVQSKWSDLRQTLSYKTEKGEALAVAVKHPSTGFNSQEWHDWLRSAIPRLFRK